MALDRAALRYGTWPADIVDPDRELSDVQRLTVTIHAARAGHAHDLHNPALVLVEQVQRKGGRRGR